MRVISGLLLLVFLAAAQPAAPATMVGTPVETTRVSPMFRPKVVIRQEIVLPKDPFLAGAMSLAVPGTGQAYCGKWFRGIGFLVGTLTSYALTGAISGDSTTLQPAAKSVGAAVFLIAGFALHGWSVLDAVHLADVHNRQWLEVP
jgi:hypothetical protein